MTTRIEEYRGEDVEIDAVITETADGNLISFVVRDRTVKMLPNEVYIIPGKTMSQIIPFAQQVLGDKRLGK